MVKPDAPRTVRVPADAAELLCEVVAALIQHYRERGTPFPPDWEARLDAAVGDVTAALGNMRQ